PKCVLSGEDALNLGMDYLNDMGTKALIVTDKMMVELGNVKKITDAMEARNVAYYVYDEINAEPTDTMIDKGVELYQKEKCDFLIGVGGGSPVDAMKAIGAVYSNGGSVRGYVGKKIEHALPCMCAIPTTSGTGSEATKFSIINNTETSVKMLISDPKLMVDYAILDPVFSLTAPPFVTAATGIDALTHALEAYTSRKAFPMSDLFAVSAIRKIFQNLYKTYENGNDFEARKEMAIAAFEAGVAFSNASVTIVHGMSRPIGALFKVPHGMSNAMLLKVCLEYLKPNVTSELCKLAEVIGVYKEGMTVEEGAEAFVAATNDLLRKLNIKTPMDYDIKKEDFFKHIPKMSTDAMASGSPLNTQRTPTAEDLMALYEQFWNESELDHAARK
ncbi:MAG: iron-containing alcohol dehydrogenase, partial [Clostridiales bacterium]|nr:iron-containing alcohol dehydrogenase [Clostridiales bacterium]